MLKIYAIDKRTEEREEITDLYWFEENHVHSFDDCHKYIFEIVVSNVVVYRSGIIRKYTHLA